MDTKQLQQLREHYSSERLDSYHLEKDPLSQFSKWIKEAIDSQLPEPNAMILATVNKEGKPSARTVLLKGLEYGKFVFYTNYTSRKSKELSANPHASLVFLWKELERQVRVEGVVERIPEEASVQYYQSRPRDSQIGAWASPQSTYVDSYKYLENRFTEYKQKFKDRKVLPKPDFWGGFGLKPERMEFWQGRPSRMHDRLEYQLNDQSRWEIHRLAP